MAANQRIKTLNPLAAVQDRWIVAGALALLFLSSFLIWDESVIFRVSSLQSHTPIIAEILKKRADLRRRPGDHYLWLNAYESELIHQADSLFTGKDSDAEIAFKDNVHITLDPESLVTFHSSQGADVIDLQSGTISGELGRRAKLMVKQNGVTHEIRNQGATESARIRITSTKRTNTPTDAISAPPKESFTLSVLSGQAELSIGEENPIPLNSGQSAKMSDEGKIKEITHTTLDLIEPQDGIELPHLPEKSIEFKWKKTKGIDHYQLEISKTDDFTHPDSSHSIEGDSFKLQPLPAPGIYYWRVRNNEVEKEMIAESISRKIRIKEELPPLLLHPPALHTIPVPHLRIHDETQTQKKTILLHWAEDHHSKDEYQVEISVESDFKSPFFQTSTSSTRVETPALASGQYFWRVKGAIWSPASSFTLVDREIDDGPGLIQPIDHQELLLELKGSLRLEWKPSEIVKSYILEIATTPDFDRDHLVLENKTTEPFFETAELSPGNYFWRVFGIEKQGEITRYSPVHSFLLNRKGPLKAPRILKKVIDHEVSGLWSPLRLLLQFFVTEARADEIPVKKPLDLDWEAVADANEYRLQIAETPDFKNLILDKKISVPHFVWDNPKPGIYYWRVAAIDKGGTSSEFSEAASIQIRAPAPLLPLQATPSRLVWKKIPSASEYEVEVALNPEFRNAKTITTSSTSIPNPYFHPDQTMKIYWKVRALGEKRKAISYFSKPGALTYEKPALPSPTPQSPRDETAPIAEAPSKTLGSVERNILAFHLGPTLFRYAETHAPNYNGIFIDGKLTDCLHLWGSPFFLATEIKGTLFSLGNSSPQYSMRRLSLGLLVLYALPIFISSVEFKLAAGGLFDTMVVAQNAFGYTDFFGGKFGLLAHKNLNGLSALELQMYDTLATESSKFELLFQYQRQIQNERLWLITLEYSSMNLAYSDAFFISNSSYTVSLGTTF